MRKNKKLKGTLNILLGLCMLLAAAGMQIHNMLESRQAEESTAQIMEEIHIDPEKLILAEPNKKPVVGIVETEPEEPVIPPMPTEEIKGHDYIGVLQVPSIHVELPILAEIHDVSDLNISPGRHAGSYFSNDLVIAGHNYGKHFGPLRGVSLGADVYFITVDNMVYHYTVGSIENMRPEQLDEILHSEWDLSIYTCNPGGTTRRVIRCSLEPQ